MASPSPERLPNWLTQLIARWSASSSVFLLSGNTRDYLNGELVVLSSDFLKTSLSKSFDSVVVYNRATGVSFGGRTSTETREQEDVFLRRAGIAAAPQPGASGPQAPQNRLPQEPLRFFPAADRALRWQSDEEGNTRPTAVVIEYAETLFPSNPVLSPEERTLMIYAQRWAIDQEISNAGGMVILVGQALSDLNPALRAASSRIEHIELPMPDYDDRLHLINGLTALSDAPLRFDGMTAQEFAAKTAGLTLLHVEDVKLRAGDGAVTRDLVRERKDEIIKSEVGDILSTDDPEWGLDDVGGLEEVKAWMMKSIIKPLTDGNLKRVPLGVLLEGPPGTGKTYVVKALAHDAGVNYRELDFGRLLNGIVGSSERNLETILRVLDASAPCLVFIDEIDQALRRGTSGLSPVQDNIFGRMLRWLSEPRHRGRIVVIAATNRPDLLDAALKRAGRFDVKIPILPPDANGRADALTKMLRRYSPSSVNCAQTIQSIGESTEGWTPAELELVLVKAMEICDDDSREVISADDLTGARDAISPARSETQFMTELAILDCSDKSLLPSFYRRQLDENRGALERSVADAAPTFRRSRRFVTEDD